MKDLETAAWGYRDWLDTFNPSKEHKHKQERIEWEQKEWWRW
jgi:hypothetical protein